MQPPPLQPAKMDPEAGTAVSVTVVPPENDREQVVPQVMPLGPLVVRNGPMSQRTFHTFLLSGLPPRSSGLISPLGPCVAG